MSCIHLNDSSTRNHNTSGASRDLMYLYWRPAAQILLVFSHLLPQKHFYCTHFSGDLSVVLFFLIPLLQHTFSCFLHFVRLMDIFQICLACSPLASIFQFLWFCCGYNNLSTVHVSRHCIYIAQLAIFPYTLFHFTAFDYFLSAMAQFSNRKHQGQSPSSVGFIGLELANVEM